MRTFRSISVACGLAGLVGVTLAPSAAAGHATAPRAIVGPLATPAAALVLGSEDYAVQGEGWGTTRPRRLDNGGVPSGIVLRIRWTRWGGRVAIGHAVKPIYSPAGGYYRTPARAILRASRIGRCEEGGRRAYTRLHVREAVRPGGPLGRWYAWGGNGGDVCGSE